MGFLVCPTCGRAVAYERRTDVPHRPFCCRRCQLIDLGRWFDEEYRVSDPLVGLGEDDESAESD